MKEIPLPMSYQDSLNYLKELEKKGIHMELGPVSRLLMRLENPHLRYKTIHIGGTNGKGSVGAILSSVLRAGGYRVGLYSSPHLVDFRERIRVDDQIISMEDMTLVIDRIRKHIREDVTYFEMATVMAFLYFQCRAVDIAVVEVGMGGRLDATNLIEPQISIVTNISLEHQQYLGRRLADIAREKGGIIKKEGLVITGARQKKVLAVLNEIARRRQTHLIRAGKDFRIRQNGTGNFSYYGINKRYRNIQLSLLGRHQIENAALALAAVEALQGRGFVLPDHVVAQGVANARWEGRLETLSRAPRVLVDGAHNPAGISALCKALQKDFFYKRLIVVFGVMGDKRFDLMLRMIARIADVLILTEPEVARTLSVERLHSIAPLSHLTVEVVKKPREALLRAAQHAGVNDLICVTGSLYLVGAIKADFPF